jgi:hypothetical protein
MNIQVLQKAGNFLASWLTVGFPRRTLLCGVNYVVSKRRWKDPLSSVYRSVASALVGEVINKMNEKLHKTQGSDLQRVLQIVCKIISFDFCVYWLTFCYLESWKLITNDTATKSFFFFHQLPVQSSSHFRATFPESVAIFNAGQEFTFFVMSNISVTLFQKVN